MNKASSKKSSFEYLFKSCYNELYIHALSFVREGQEAEDIVSDVYEYVWKNWERLGETTALRPLCIPWFVIAVSISSVTRG